MPQSAASAVASDEGNQCDRRYQRVGSKEGAERSREQFGEEQSDVQAVLQEPRIEQKVRDYGANYRECKVHNFHKENLERRKLREWRTSVT